MTKQELLAKVSYRLNKQTPFEKSDSAWIDCSLRALELMHETGISVDGVDAYAGEVNEFFRGKDVQDNPLVRDVQLRNTTIKELRAYAGMNEGSSIAGGDLVPLQFYKQVISAMKQADGLLDCARRIYTTTGAALSVPTADDTSVNATIVMENGPITQVNPVFGVAAFGQTPLWSTGQILCSYQLLQDSGIDLTQWFAEVFARRLARGQGAAWITTLLSGVATGVTTASATAITPSEIVSLFASLDAAYANSPRAGWLMNFSTWAYILKLADTQGRFIFQPIEYDAAGHPLLLGKPVYISPNMPSIAATAKSVIYGDFDFIVIREAMDRLAIARYDELFMAQHQLGFQGFHRADFALVSPVSGSAPALAALVQHS